MKTGVAIIAVAWVWLVAVAHGQGTIQITFDGPPLILAGSAIGVTNYEEAGMSFKPIPHPPPGLPQFGRSGGGRVEFADNGTPYLIAGLGDSLMFSFSDGMLFDMISVDLAEFSITVTNTTARFVGYRPDGSTVTTDLTTDGVIDGPGGFADFQTFTFGPEFSGLTHVEIPTYGWSLDNLVVAVPEPSALSLLGGGVLLLAWAARRLRRQ